MKPSTERRRAGYTEVPNVFIDRFMASCKGSEVKVMLYLLRRTRGFQKSSDRVGVRQIYRGLQGKGGAVLDLGTGLSMGTVQRGPENSCQEGASREGTRLW